MSRSFPEPADVMAAYRLHRGVDIRDVADGHVLALTNEGAPFQRHILSGSTPFAVEDCEALAGDAASVIRLRCPGLAAEFQLRGWSLPTSIDRVYDPAAAIRDLNWSPRFGFDEVFAQLDRRSLEVMPLGSQMNRKPE
ncbi:nucleoside-diphosphate-sugar epimerase [Rhizobium sp. BK181]|uniref:hypothetical protein n=1 Tax=Rhizobium sp. BK181 TaxID=2587072 RepID=UPI0017A2721F|nr:hypothetical protein [Rhizobium sp. BK181]MBB3316673.1 nucleoside-diphosphate-sugar epimerase [Rhizobium sp. BK181]